MVLNDSDKQKAIAFVEHLLSNSALMNFTALQKEEQILQFLTVNSAQLFPTLSSSAFFPGRDWEEIKSILLGTLKNIINKLIVPDLQVIVSKLDLTFFSLLGGGEFNDNSTKRIILELLTKILSHDQARRIFTGSFTAVKNGIIRGYVDNLYVIRKYIHFEITKVEHLKFSEHETENMLTLVSLLRPLIYLMHSNGSGGRTTGNGIVFQNAITVQVAKTIYSKTSRNTLRSYAECYELKCFFYRK